MHRTDNATSTPVLPPPTAAGPNPNSYFQAGTIVDAEWLTMFQEELISVLVAAGIAPNKAAYNQLYVAIDSLINTVAGSLDTALVNSAHDWEDNQYISEKLLAYAASQSWNVLLGQNVRMTLTGNCTISAITNAQAGAVYVFRAIQDATGNREITWPADVHWPNGVTPTLSDAANQQDLITLYYTGSIFLGNISKGYSS